MYLNTGEKGKSLREIIEELGNKSYNTIECRCLYMLNGQEQDDFFGDCSYDAETKTLKSLDGDSYSLDDLYIKWKESLDCENNNRLIVWEYGEYSNEWIYKEK